MRNLLVLLALVTGCTGAPTDDDVIDFPINDGKTDFWSEVQMHGNLDYDTPVHLDYTPLPHQFWGYKLVGTFDDQVDITMRSADGYPDINLYDANKKLIGSNYAPVDWPPHIAHLSVPIAASGTLYLVIADLDDRPAHFDLTATHAPICHPAICTSDQCGSVPDGCGAQESCGPCLPTTIDPICTSFGMSCGRIYPPDHNIGIECGGCSGGESCGGAGVENICGVAPGHTWLTDLPQMPSGLWSAKATFTLTGIQNNGVHGTDETTRQITCTVDGIPGHGLPSVYCSTDRAGSWGSLRSDGSFMLDNRSVAGSQSDLVFAGTIEPHARMRLTEYSENYYDPSYAKEWAFPCLQYSSPIRCVASTSWTTSATAALPLWTP